MSIYMEEIENLPEIARLANAISNWHAAQILSNSRVPDFWDECETSDKLAQFLISRGWRND